jgi:hypothetical protein
MSYVVVHRKLNLQNHLHLGHPTLVNEICDRFGDDRHGYGSDCEVNMNDDVECDRDCGSVVGEANEISLSVMCKLFSIFTIKQASRQGIIEEFGLCEKIVGLDRQGSYANNWGKGLSRSALARCPRWELTTNVARGCEMA